MRVQKNSIIVFLYFIISILNRVFRYKKCLHIYIYIYIHRFYTYIQLLLIMIAKLIGNCNKPKVISAINVFFRDYRANFTVRAHKGHLRPTGRASFARLALVQIAISHINRTHLEYVRSHLARRSSGLYASRVTGRLT